MAWDSTAREVHGRQGDGEVQELCDANECEYCVMSYEPFEQCPIDELRRRMKECE